MGLEIKKAPTPEKDNHTQGYVKSKSGGCFFIKHGAVEVVTDR